MEIRRTVTVRDFAICRGKKFVSLDVADRQHKIRPHWEVNSVPLGRDSLIEKNDEPFFAIVINIVSH